MTGIKLGEIDTSLLDVELTPSLMAKMMSFKMSYIFLIFLVGCSIVVVYDFVSPGFSVYDADSALTIAALFALFSGIEVMLLVSKKLTPITVIMIGMASPFILLKRFRFQNIISTAPERIIGYVLPYGIIIIYKYHAGCKQEYNSLTQLCRRHNRRALPAAEMHPNSFGCGTVKLW